MRISGTGEQLKFLAGFCSNAAVAWFVAAFVAPVDFLTAIRSAVNMIVLLLIGLYLLEEVR